MSLIARIFGNRPDPREQLRPLWHRVIELSREPDYYASCRVADSVEGRFDMVVAMLCLVLLRMEKSPDTAANAAFLTELFVEDMDGQLRESGVGDVVVGKRMGKLMSVLGGRLGAFRDALADDQPEALLHVLERNITWADAPDQAGLATRLGALSTRLAELSDARLLKGEIA